jgi:membrane associated rhomboid family serine protease
MGIYDREYYRDERSSFLGSLNRQGQVWKTLILINVIVFVAQLAFAQHRGVDGDLTNWFRIDTAAILRGEVWRLLTGAFLHSAGWQHIVFNMLILWWAGSEVEGIYGPREFLAFYLTAAVLASVAYVANDLVQGSRSTALGASGAVTAVLVLFALHFPNRTVLLFFIIPVPVIVLVTIYVVIDALGVLGARPGENIGFAAHLGGAAFGFLYYKFHWRITNLLPSNWSFNLGRARPKLRVYRAEPQREPYREPVPAATPARPESDRNLELELDAVLEKVARQGKSSLTEREHQILMRASEIYRNRRK